MSTEVIILNPIGITEEQFEVIEQMAAANFSAEQIAIYLDLNVQFFLNEFNNSGSEVYRRYHKGLLNTAFEINSKLAANSRAGNITAMQQFEKHKDNIKVENLKQKYFG